MLKHYQEVQSSTEHSELVLNLGSSRNEKKYGSIQFIAMNKMKDLIS